MDRKPQPGAPDPPPGLEPEDYYFEGPYLVFTAAYHLKRGFCCGSGCRHCPYREETAEEAQTD
ncbi:MAG TPA: DUF5522 domain-containing protein [Terracidiphilus sp.]